MCDVRAPCELTFTLVWIHLNLYMANYHPLSLLEFNSRWCVISDSEPEVKFALKSVHVKVHTWRTSKHSGYQEACKGFIHTHTHTHQWKRRNNQKENPSAVHQSRDYWHWGVEEELLPEAYCDKLLLIFIHALFLFLRWETNDSWSLSHRTGKSDPFFFFLFSFYFSLSIKTFL